MKTLLIIDDEYYIRVRVRKCIDWEALGFGEILDCANGQEALALMTEHPVDLVVADISMPVMDGLSLCEALRERQADTQIILLTGYDRFDYVKQALSYGVVEYVLKPVDGEELEKAVQKACARMKQNASLRIIQQEKRVLEHEKNRLQLELAVTLLFSDGYMGSRDTPPILADFGIREADSYAVVYVQTEKACTLPGTVWTRLAHGQVGIVEESALAQVTGALAMEPLLTAGVSALHRGTPQELHEAYREARFILAQRLITPDKRLFHYAEYQHNRLSSWPERMKAHCLALQADIRDGNARKVQADTDAALACLSQERGSVHELYVFVRWLLLEMQTSGAHGQRAWDERALFDMQAAEILQNSRSLQEVRQQLAHCIDQYMHREESAIPAAGILLVNRVHQLVRENYQDESLSPSGIAQALSMNASYLSDAFRRYGGETLSHCITRVRMEKAGELLSGSDRSLTEVMEQVGYKDPYYFSKRFKKYFGCTPTAWRAGAVKTEGDSKR
ncbi:MAG: response regulator [Aristaeellaceae bacterium]